MGTLSSLAWLNRFLSETPGDPVTGGSPRQVQNACWSRVSPTPSPNPTLRLWSDEMAETLGLEKGDTEILAGGKTVTGMDAYAQR